MIDIAAALQLKPCHRKHLLRTGIKQFQVEDYRGRRQRIGASKNSRCLLLRGQKFGISGKHQLALVIPDKKFCRLTNLHHTETVAKQTGGHGLGQGPTKTGGDIKIIEINHCGHNQPLSTSGTAHPGSQLQGQLLPHPKKIRRNH